MAGSNSPSSTGLQTAVLGNFRNDSKKDILRVFDATNGNVVRIDSNGVISPASAPVFQNSFFGSGVNAPFSVSSPIGTTGLYNVGLYLFSYGTGGAGTTMTTTITWTGPSTLQHSIQIILAGDSQQVQQENYVLFNLTGSSLSISSAFSSTPFEYDAGISISLLPGVGQ